MKPDRVVEYAEKETAEDRDVADLGAPALLDHLLTGTRKPAGGIETLTGHLEGIDDEGRLLFRPDGSTDMPAAVSIGLELSDGQLVRAARQGRRALVLRTAGDNPRWMLIGLVRDRVSAKAREAAPGQLEVVVDGETLRLDAQEQIELRCGKSSIVLNQNGRIVISGVYVLAKSRGPVKLKGATIALN